jgi:hypothetical protein
MPLYRSCKKKKCRAKKIFLQKFFALQVIY